MPTGFWVAKANTDGTIMTESAVELTPGPSAVEYPDAPAAKQVETTEGRVIKQTSAYDPRKRAWVWQGYRGYMSAYQSLWLTLQSLLASRRTAFGATTPYVYLKDTTTNDLQVLTRETGTASAGGADALTDSSKTGGTAWTADQFNGYTVEIVAGTGKGQMRTVLDTTTSPSRVQVTVAWGTQPDNTSKYAIYKWVSGWVRVRVLEVSRTPRSGGGDVAYETTRMVFYVDDLTTVWNDLG